MKHKMKKQRIIYIKLSATNKKLGTFEAFKEKKKLLKALSKGLRTFEAFNKDCKSLKLLTKIEKGLNKKL